IEGTEIPQCSGGSVVSSLHCMNDPQAGGSHSKPHRTTKILSYARRRGGVAARGASAAAGDAGDGHPPHAHRSLSTLNEGQHLEVSDRSVDLVGDGKSA